MAFLKSFARNSFHYLLMAYLIKGKYPYTSRLPSSALNDLIVLDLLRMTI